MPKQRSSVRNRTEELAVRFAHAIFRLVPPARAEGMGRALGLAFRRFAGERRALAERNLARAFPEKSAGEVAALAREVFAHFGGMAADLLTTLDEPLDSVLERVEVVNEEAARQAVASGRGVFFLASHLGNWELAAIAAATRGLPMTVIARPLDNPLLEERLKRFRERSGNTVLPKGDAAREMLRTVRKGGTVGILIDQHAHPPDAVVAPFFGRPASTTSFLARLADRTEALILPAAATRIGARRYRLVFESPLDVRDLADTEREVEPLTARLNTILEEQIRAAPGQWLWLHNRWRLD